MFDTKIAIVLREDLAPWQALNVTAFLTSGLVGKSGNLIGEPYTDKSGNYYYALLRQPVIVLSADGPTLGKIHGRTLTRDVTCALYLEEMFKTGHDDANRAVFAEFGPEDANVVGLALHADRKVVDKITKGARMHG